MAVAARQTTTGPTSKRRRVRGQIATIAAAMVIGVIVFAALFAPQLAPYDPYQVELPSALQEPSWEHWLGTDMQGRDLLSRIMYGTRLTLLTSLTALLIGSACGGLLGLEAAKASLDMGLGTHVIEFAPRLMPRQLDDQASSFLRDKIAELRKQKK